MVPSRPAETASAVAASVLGALLIVLGSMNVGWVERITPEVMGALVTLVGWIAVGVTWYTAHQQRKGELRAAKDGSVRDVPTP